MKKLYRFGNTYYAGNNREEVMAKTMASATQIIEIFSDVDVMDMLADALNFEAKLIDSIPNLNLMVYDKFWVKLTKSKKAN